jgi:hypothetical protein
MEQKMAVAKIKGLVVATATIIGWLLVAGLQPAHAVLRFSSGFDYTSGKYGAVDDTEILYVPFTIKYEGATSLFRITVPFLSIKAPVGGDIIAIGPDGQPIREGTGEKTTDSGMGDVVTAYTYYLYESSASRTFIDLTGKIKFGTADETKGLGTGENDYSAQLDLYKTVGSLTGLLTGGYRVYGDPPGVDFDNVFYASIGGVFKQSPATSIGVIYDFRQKIQTVGDPLSELTAYVAHKSGKDTKFQWYVLTGFTDASPDWGLGFTFNVVF